MNKAISIIIPAYNAEKTISACLASIASQTFKDFEIVITNDGSIDGTESIINQFSYEHPELIIRIISIANSGVSMARKVALEAASGDWVAFVDADDTLPCNALENLYLASTKETDLVVGFLNIPKNKITPQQNPESWQHAIVEGIIPPSIGAKLYRRSILSPDMLDIPRNITNGEDALMNIAYVFAMTKPPVFVYEHVYNYYRQPISLSHITMRTMDYELEYDKLRLQAIPQSKQSKYMNSIIKYRLNGIAGCCRSDYETVADKSHPLFAIVNNDINQSNYKLSLFEKILLNVRSPYIIRNLGIIRCVVISMRYRTLKMFSRTNRATI